MNDRDDFDELIAATKGVQPRRDFADRVMAEIGDRSDPNDRAFWQQLPRVARRVVPAFVIAAAAGAFWAFRSFDLADEATITGNTTDQILNTFTPAEDSE